MKLFGILCVQVKGGKLWKSEIEEYKKERKKIYGVDDIILKLNK